MSFLWLLARSVAGGSPVMVQLVEQLPGWRQIQDRGFRSKRTSGLAFVHAWQWCASPRQRFRTVPLVFDTLLSTRLHSMVPGSSESCSWTCQRSARRFGRYQTSERTQDCLRTVLWYQPRVESPPNQAPWHCCERRSITGSSSPRGRDSPVRSEWGATLTICKFPWTQRGRLVWSFAWSSLC